MSQLGHSLPIHLAPVLANVRYAPKATKMVRRGERREVPIAVVAPTTPT
jgi:hypothetical protein